MRDNRNMRSKFYKSYSLTRRWNKTRGLNEQTKRELMLEAVKAFKDRFKSEDFRSLELLLRRPVRGEL